MQEGLAQRERDCHILADNRLVGRTGPEGKTGPVRWAMF